MLAFFKSRPLKHLIHAHWTALLTVSHVKKRILCLLRFWLFGIEISLLDVNN